jgi:hypothetical protein
MSYGRSVSLAVCPVCLAPPMKQSEYDYSGSRDLIRRVLPNRCRHILIFVTDSDQ